MTEEEKNDNKTRWLFFLEIDSNRCPFDLVYISKKSNTRRSICTRRRLGYVSSRERKKHLFFVSFFILRNSIDRSIIRKSNRLYCDWYNPRWSIHRWHERSSIDDFSLCLSNRCFTSTALYSSCLCRWFRCIKKYFLRSKNRIKSRERFILFE